MKDKPKGWFVRRVRHYLEYEWDQESLRLGPVNRWRCREAAWDRAEDGIGMGSVQRLIRERFEQAEQKVLDSNQQAFRKAIKCSRENVDPQLSLPGMVRNELYANLHPIRDRYIRVPGPDKDFSQLIQIKDIDFEVIEQMSVVRDEGIRKDLLSKEDYDFMDNARRSLKAAIKQTLGRVFGLDEDTAA